MRLALFILNDPELVGALSQTAERRNLDLRVLLDRTQFTNLERRKDNQAKTLIARLQELKKRGSLRLCDPSPQLHHKFAVIDDLLVTGSANWTKAAFGKNHEAVVLVSPNKKRGEDSALVATYLEHHEALWKLAKP